MRKPLLKISHRKPKSKRVTAKEHDEAYRKIGCTDNLKPLKNRDRVTRKQRRK